jgi:hypothetical protein
MRKLKLIHLIGLVAVCAFLIYSYICVIDFEKRWNGFRNKALYYSAMEQECIRARADALRYAREWKEQAESANANLQDLSRKSNVLFAQRIKQEGEKKSRCEEYANLFHSQAEELQKAATRFAADKERYRHKW